MRSLMLCLALAVAVSAALTFVRPPTLSKTGTDWSVDFEVSENTDVEVAIVSLKDSTIIRRLAAGVLGVNPPSPLLAGSFRQTLAWDGKDEQGNSVTLPAESLSVRVRAGMRPVLDCMVGENPYCFKSFGYGNCSFNGLVRGADGNIYIYGTSGTNRFLTIRQYDGEGRYLKTVFPWPANAALESINTWGTWTWADGRVSPRTTYVADPNLTGTFVSGRGKSMAGVLLPLGKSGELYVAEGGYGQTIRLGTDGSLPDKGAQFNLITSPALPPSSYRTFGNTYLIQSHDTNFAYFSAFWEASKIDGGCHLVEAADTGFWKDGQVFRLNLKTGAVSPWLKLDSIPLTPALRSINIGNEYYSSVHGVAIDDKNHVFVCDRLHGRVGVYDTAANLLGAIKVRFPDFVYVDNGSGQVYVLTRNRSGYQVGQITLNKYSGWGPADTLICSMPVTSDIGDGKYTKAYFAVAKADKPVVWLGYANFGIRAYRDEGDTFTLVKDFYRDNKANTGFDRIAVDRRNETVYLNDSWVNIYKIEDWSAPRVLACSTSAKKILNGRDMAVSREGYLYLQEGTGFSGPVTRYTTERYHAPMPFPNTGKNVLTPYIYSRMGAGMGEHGIAVGKDNRVAIMYMYNWCQYFVGVYGDSGCTDTNKCDSTVFPVSINGPGCGGVRYDARNNLYIGATVRNPSSGLPAAVTSDKTYDRSSGAVVRYPADGRGSVLPKLGAGGANGSAPGSDRIFKPDFAPLSGYGDCQCRSGRFDVDDYGRVFIPNALAQQVSVVDNNDNVILQFGRYANADSRGPGSAVPVDGIPLAWPVGVGVSDNYIYVNDMINARMVRVKMDYTLDNLPGVGYHMGVAGNDVVGARCNVPLQLTATPNPFNPVCHIIATLSRSQHAVLQILDITGRQVMTLADRKLAAGDNRFVWNGKDDKGRDVAAGLYLYSLTTKDHVMAQRVILAR